LFFHWVVDVHYVHSLACSHAACWRGCLVSMSYLRWQGIPFMHHVFSVMHTNVIPTAIAIVNSDKKFPMALVPNRKTIYIYMKKF